LRADKSDEWFIGIIGGSGLAGGIGLEDAQEIAVSSPFGDSSGPVTIGRLGGLRFAFLPRHGGGHGTSPAAVNFRANVDVLKRCGVTDVLAISAVGSLREDMKPGDFVAVNDFIDRTTARERSFFGPGLVAHVSMADPVCPRFSALAAGAARLAGADVHEGGCYVCIEGPQFSTRAESHLYRAWGADVIGMTALPEARLAREAELPYAMLGMVTDYDCWHDAEAGVEASDILAVMRANAGLARAALCELARMLPPERTASPIDRALDHAIVTAPSQRDAKLCAMLDAVAGRALRAT